MREGVSRHNSCVSLSISARTHFINLSASFLALATAVFRTNSRCFVPTYLLPSSVQRRPIRFYRICNPLSLLVGCFQDTLYVITYFLRFRMDGGASYNIPLDTK